MVNHKKPILLPPAAFVFTVLAATGAAAFLSFWAMFAVVRFADIEVAESLFWAWVLVGMLGLAAALVFGTLAVVTVRAGARIRGVPARRVELALLATLCILAALFLIGQTYAYLLVVALLLVIAVFAFYRLWRGAHP
jgi:hypothetical protein